MITLYESILSDMDDIIDKGDEISDNMLINDENSNLRNIFSIRAPGSMGALKEPFIISGKNDKTLLIKVGARSPSIYSSYIYGNNKYGSVSDTVSDVSTVWIEGGANIYTNKDINKVLANTIISDNITLNGYTYLDDTNISNTTFIAKKSERIQASNLIKNIILKNISSLTNCTLEVEAHKSDNSTRLGITHKLPTFKNVKSKSIQYIYISNGVDDGNGNKPMPIDLSRFNALFETGYSLKCSYDDKTTSFKVKDLLSLKKVVNITNKTYNYDFSEYPYKLKNSAKLSDILDVSKFDSLQSIVVNDWKNKLGMLFINTKSPYYKTDKCKNYINGYKYNLARKANNGNFQDISVYMSEAPITSDGWQLFLYKL